MTERADHEHVAADHPELEPGHRSVSTHETTDPPAQPGDEDERDRERGQHRHLREPAVEAVREREDGHAQDRRDGAEIEVGFPPMRKPSKATSFAGTSQRSSSRLCACVS